MIADTLGEVSRALSPLLRWGSRLQKKVRTKYSPSLHDNIIMGTPLSLKLAFSLSLPPSLCRSLSLSVSISVWTQLERFIKIYYECFCYPCVSMVERFHHAHRARWNISWHSCSILCNSFMCILSPLHHREGLVVKRSGGHRRVTNCLGCGACCVCRCSVWRERWPIFYKCLAMIYVIAQAREGWAKLIYIHVHKINACMQCKAA